MKLLQLLAPLLTWVSVGLAQDSSPLMTALATIPECAQICVANGVAQSSCQLTDLHCICTNAQMQASVEICVLKSCPTLRQGLITKSATATLCQKPIRNKSRPTRLTNLILAFITWACVFSRLIHKTVFSVGGFGYDDYTVFAVLFAGLPSVILIEKGVVPNGLGQDVWTVPFDHITNFVRFLYPLESLYFLQIGLVKLTLLFFCLRIFPKQIMKRVLWGTISFVIVWTFAFIIASIVQCAPISYYWTSWDKDPSRHGKCVNINALAWTHAAMSILLDIWMLALPLSEVFRLQLTWRKKASVTMMFLVGTFVTVVSILRLQSLVTFATSSNPTWDQVDVVMWSNIEVNVGIICACLPALRAILVRLCPKVFATTRGTSQPNYGTGTRRMGYKLEGSASSPSAAGKSGSKMGRDANTIVYTKTFEVQNAETDETSLVRMEEFESARKAMLQSSSTSVSSV